jgi:hypothetical protein
MKCPKCGRELISTGILMGACICTILNHPSYVPDNVYDHPIPVSIEQPGGGNINFSIVGEPYSDSTRNPLKQWLNE